MSSFEQASVPKESTTVILVRKNDAGLGEVFLARRHQRQSFMAGAYVFPGGQVDAADSDLGLSRYISATDNFTPQTILQDASLTEELAQSLFVCAIRETFEETGVLFAQTGGIFIQLDSGQEIVRFAHYRQELNRGKISLQDIAAKENLFFACHALIPYAHWITPEIVPKRFSTRFFLARLPDGQTATTDSDELTDFLWVTPGDALQMQLNKEIMLMPPTLKTVEELAAFADIDELFEHTRHRTIYPILPEAAANILLLPHDPEYGIAKYKRPARPNEPSRFISVDGIWQTGHYLNK
ncbi:MAG: NUDIX domain-containing protein [Smithellaceae bacterium]|nr:NUDIX domain-containing protein [Smithellaceae bacterium]